MSKSARSFRGPLKTLFFLEISMFQCLSSPVHMPILMEIPQTVVKKMHKVGKSWFVVIPCIGQRKYSVSAAAMVHPVYQFHGFSGWKIEHNFLYC